ncbi:radical SAM protein [Vulcanisaeta distributa]|uniref:Radical SAM domain protein n=1 Tax=Vulcanisaeta distributa (strain DSM 14429 / JCM 11212 / NBRC 100878 / IC-017) TaxID=572478 RepID=E1QSJ4_VULDI|nr:radical SAM protein [Vulcanisaeta distributa]ADN50787.1 Radical SAM domain protein [Vulcanisaeta distributa DSM 14429]
MSTRISHITYYIDLRSAYVQFLGCNFTCPWCIRRLTPWDHHLENKELVRLKFQGLLNIDEFLSIIDDAMINYGLEETVLGGEEPTIDPMLPTIIRELRDRKLRIRLLTNAYEISNELLNELSQCTNCEVVIGIKTLDPDKHIKYTGKPLEPVLRNIRRLIKSNVRVIFETVLIPSLNDAKDIEEIAKYLASIVRDPVLIIDPLIPIPGTPWRRPTREELSDAMNSASKYVKAMSHERLGRSSEVIVLYPRPR